MVPLMKFMLCCEQGEEEWRQVEQVEVLLRTLYLLSPTRLEIYVITNSLNIYQRILEPVMEWNTDSRLSLHQVAVRYPAGLESLLDMFRVCSTARLFLDQMLPEVDSGIFLDTDTLVMDDIRALWSHFK